MELFKLLEGNTSSMGSFSLSYNEHRDCYEKPEEHYPRIFKQDELELIDFSKDIYRLCWCKDTPIGHYDFISNTLENIEKQVKEFLKQ